MTYPQPHQRKRDPCPWPGYTPRGEGGSRAVAAVPRLATRSRLLPWTLAARPYLSPPFPPHPHACATRAHASHLELVPRQPRLPHELPVLELADEDLLAAAAAAAAGRGAPARSARAPQAAAPVTRHPRLVHSRRLRLRARGRRVTRTGGSQEEARAAAACFAPQRMRRPGRYGIKRWLARPSKQFVLPNLVGGPNLSNGFRVCRCNPQADVPAQFPRKCLPPRSVPCPLPGCSVPDSSLLCPLPGCSVPESSLPCLLPGCSPAVLCRRSPSTTPATAPLPRAWVSTRYTLPGPSACTAAWCQPHPAPPPSHPAPCMNPVEHLPSYPPCPACRGTCPHLRRRGVGMVALACGALLQLPRRHGMRRCLRGGALPSLARRPVNAHAVLKAVPPKAIKRGAVVIHLRRVVCTRVCAYTRGRHMRAGVYAGMYGEGGTAHARACTCACGLVAFVVGRQPGLRGGRHMHTHSCLYFCAGRDRTGNVRPSFVPTYGAHVCGCI
eukprot:360543-Chlamydomonas_euryale.AAC.2